MEGQQPATRRSARQPVPNRRYRTDAFAGIPDLEDSADEPRISNFDKQYAGEDIADEDFEEPMVDEEEDEPLEEDEGSVPDEEADPAAGAGDYDEDEIDDDEVQTGSALLVDEDAVNGNAKAVKQRAAVGRKVAQPRHREGGEISVARFGRIEFIPRGRSNHYKNLSKSVRLVHFYGLTDEDLLPILKARDKWNDEIALPSRRPGVSDIGGMAYSFSHTREMRDREARVGWQWYRADEGGERLRSRQVMDTILEVEGIPYLPKTWNSTRKFLIGPYPNQRLVDLLPGQCMALDEAWTQSAETGTGQVVRPGFVMNVGGKVHCLGWVPNQNFNRQYLAVSTLPLIEFKLSERDRKVRGTAFVPSGPTPAAIQIWACPGSEDERRGGAVIPMGQPFLHTVLCTEWGDIKQFQWCPMVKLYDPKEEGQLQKKYMGLLAIVSSDGHLRVLDVWVPLNKANKTQYLHIEKAAFSAKPPNTLYTCIHWLGPNHLAAGCADGSLSIWDLSTALTSPNPKPTHHFLLHTTYVLSITSGYPSRPHFLLSNSMDGYARITDLRNPTSDTVFSQRDRTASSSIVWHEQSQSALSADETNVLRAHPARRFYATVSVGRLPAGATALAVSPVHPFVLTASLDGTVLASNPLRRIIHSKATPYQQTWFQHSWSDRRVPGGLSRFVEGFKVNAISFDEERGRDAYEGTMTSTVYEEGSAVGCLAWNPNLHVGGWAAAGCADGLVRVEDLCIDKGGRGRARGGGGENAGVGVQIEGVPQGVGDVHADGSGQDGSGEVEQQQQDQPMAGVTEGVPEVQYGPGEV